MGLQRNILAVLTAAFAWRVAKFVHSTGELRELNNILASSGRCKRVHADFHGYEDFAVFEDGGMVVFASDHAHFAFNFGTSMRQAIAAKDPEPPHVLGLFNGEWTPLQLSGAPSDFHPHGLAARGNLRGSGELLVVNHRSTHDTLELFAVEDGGRTLRHSRTESHELMFNLNDCVFRGGEPEVYCTNWRSYETGTTQDAVEVYGQRPWSYVVRCHLLEHTCEKVADGIKMANGIEMRGSHVIVVSSLEPAILVYSETDGNRGPLALAHKIPTRSACDNLVWDGEHSLLAACHPRALTFVRHSKAPTKHVAPCEVLRVANVLNASRASKRTIYMDSTGSEFSACSVAAKAGDALWIGAVHDRGMLRCSGS